MQKLYMKSVKKLIVELVHIAPSALLYRMQYSNNLFLFAEVATAGSYTTGTLVRLDEQDELESEHDSNDAEYGLSGVRRPMNAFFIFCKRHRDIVREKYPHLENRSITKILGEWWANLEPSEKTSYTALAKQYKEAFMKANPDFKWYKLPTPPTRTLVTRPSNHRCLQSQRDKKYQKQPSCGITLGKLADDTQLGGLSSLISPVVSASNSSSTDSDNSAISVLPSHSTSISKNILKPPKKRYLVNGEFKCHTEDTNVVRDHQTENACSTLLEFAEICANSENRKTISGSSGVSESFSECNTSASSPKKSVSDCIISLPLSVSPSNKIVPASSTYPTHCDVQKAENCSTSFSQLIATSSSVKNASNDESEVTVQQDQPLNLCKEKEKTITASHQQLIDHLVDKFLCGPTDSQSSHFASVLNPQFHNILIPNKYHRNISKLGKDKPAKTDFVMSVAIESAVDQAYNKDLLKTDESKQFQQSKFAEQIGESNDEMNKSDLNKLKDVNITEFKNPTETTYSRNLFFKSETLGKNRIVNAETNINDNQDRDHTSKGLAIKRTFDSNNELKTDLSANKMKIDCAVNKPECKLISPPKKSRIWCNTFMNEQLKNGNNTDCSNNSKTCIIADPLSPVRRNLQRTCKGRRYQALITEGLLQSAKERKPATTRKSLSISDKAKSEYAFATDRNAVFTTPRKKKKKDNSEKNKVHLKSQEFEKCIFDLEEKIAALPKCSIETLNKKKKAVLDSETISKNSDSTENSNISNASCSKTNFKESPDATTSENSISEIAIEDSSSIETNIEDVESVMSSGRFKTGNFDLEKHIASLPKCDIEMMNKRKHKKN